MRTLTLAALTQISLLTLGCATTGRGWMEERWDANHDSAEGDSTPPRIAPTENRRSARSLVSIPIGTPPRAEAGLAPAFAPQEGSGPTRVSMKGRPRAIKGPLPGRVLGTFRNTYYDFPSESEFSGTEKATLYNAQCKFLAEVPLPFFETLCVQGSGLLSNGAPVSFNRRDCECARVCTKTNQRICFDQLELAKFPWGRGASGGPITPLLTVAVDTSVIPLHTPLYIPEFDGAPRDLEQRSLHDGCFVAQDRGLNVKGQHVDIFTGQRRMTALWNGLVPSNQGVTVVLDAPKCARSK